MNNQDSLSLALQTWTIRNELEKDAEAIIKNIATIGFKSVETTDLNLALKLQPLLQKYNISIKSSFLLWFHISKNWQYFAKINAPYTPTYKGIKHEIELAQHLKIKKLVFGYWLPEERKTLDDYKRLSDKLNNAGLQCREAGIKLLYHNHAFEFEPIDSQLPYTILIENAQEYTFELDAFWLAVAGFDPIEFIKKYAHHISQLHLKCGIIPKTAHFDDQSFDKTKFRALGKGQPETDSIIEIAIKNGITSFFYEQDYTNNLKQDLTESFSYFNEYFVRQKQTMIEKRRLKE